MVELIWDGKYDKDGKRVAPLRVKLPFQTVETVSESAQQRQMSLDFSSVGKQTEWRNRLIWGDKKYVLPSLLDKFAGMVDLIYIDPPFNIGADFSFTANIPDLPETMENEADEFIKLPSAIEQKAYRDTWGKGLAGYTHWFSDTIGLLYELLTDQGSLFVHLDWHMAHYAQVILDEVFGREKFINQIIWYYYNKFQGNINHFAANHDIIFWYSKSEKFKFTPLYEKRETPTKQLARRWDKESGKIVNVKNEEGRVVYQESVERRVDDVWRISMLQPADKTENLRYPTQKPEALLERIISASSGEGDLILDCFCGAGTTAAVAEKLNRRWIACDLGRFAIHTTRKRLLGIPGVKPFVVQNLGKYERQTWQASEFGGKNQAEAIQKQYRNFILELYSARSIDGYTWLHGVRDGRMIHVGSVDSPVAPNDITQICIEFKKAVGSGKDAPKIAAVDVLGWDFAFEINEIGMQQAQAAGINLRCLKIPREVMDPKAIEQGDVKFFELAALSVKAKTKKQELELKLTDFTIPPDDVPEDVQKAIKHWSQWIDYWAVDWDNREDTFHNQWQSYRTRQDMSLKLETSHVYEQPGEYVVMVKVIDILGNDTTKTIKVKVG